MPAGSETLIAGGYTATYGGTALGMFEGDGGLPTLQHSNAAEEIRNTSVYGKSMIDGVYQGANWNMSMTCMEYKSGPLAAFWPYNATLGQMGTIGVLLYSLAAAVVLTAIAGTSAAATPATLTASKCILQVGFLPQILYGPRLRTLALRFQLLPYTSGGNVIWFSQT